MDMPAQGRTDRPVNYLLIMLYVMRVLELTWRPARKPAQSTGMDENWPFGPANSPRGEFNFWKVRMILLLNVLYDYLAFGIAPPEVFGIVNHSDGSARNSAPAQHKENRVSRLIVV